MKHQLFFTAAFRHAYDELPKGCVFRKGFREKEFTLHITKTWIRPVHFENFEKGKDVARREVDFVRMQDGKHVATCELKIYPDVVDPTHTNKAFTAVADAVLKQLIRQVEGEEAEGFVAAVLPVSAESETEAIRKFQASFIVKLHLYFHVNCSEVSAARLGQHWLFVWQVQLLKSGRENA